MSRTISIQPAPGRSHEGRQWGYHIFVDGMKFADVWTGGTGPCWNVLLADDYEADSTMHVCDLDELIAALTALRDSDAHRANAERWQ